VDYQPRGETHGKLTSFGMRAFSIMNRRLEHRAAIGTTIWDLITVAYTGNPRGCRDVTLMNVISGGPARLKSDRWDVTAGLPVGVLSAADVPRPGRWRNEKPSKLQT
jgi:hypothetical protein